MDFPINFFCISGDYAVEIYCAMTREQAWTMFLAKNAIIFDDRDGVYRDLPGTEKDLGYPWAGLTIDSVEEMKVVPGYWFGYME